MWLVPCSAGAGIQISSSLCSAFLSVPCLQKVLSPCVRSGPDPGPRNVLGLGSCVELGH